MQSQMLMGSRSSRRSFFGLDTDTLETADQIIRVHPRVPHRFLTINVLYALPKTTALPTARVEGRLVPRKLGRESNIAFRLPYESGSSDMWRRWLRAATSRRRFKRCYQARYVRPRKDYPSNPSACRAPTCGWPGQSSRGLWRVGVLGPYRRTFWRWRGPRCKARKIEPLIHVALVSHHLIEFTRDCVAKGWENRPSTRRAIRRRCHAGAATRRGLRRRPTPASPRWAQK